MMTDFKQRIASLPVSDRIGSRSKRRALVLVIAGGYGMLCAGSIGTTITAPLVHTISLAIYAASIALIFGAMMLLLRRTSINAPNISEAAFDERERARRNDAIQRSQPIIGLAVACCFVYAVFAEMLFPAIRSFGFMSLLLTGTLILTMALPTAILAWTEPDPVPGEA
jgi:hypothetical protein